MTVHDLTEVTEKINDLTFCLICDFSSLSESNKSMFFQFIVALTEKALSSIEDDAPASVKALCKKYMYYFQHFCIKAEKASLGSATDGNARPTKSKATKGSKSKKAASSSDTFNWIDSRASCLLLLEKIVSSNLSKIWAMGIVQENFLSGIWVYALKLLDERPAGVAGQGHTELAVRRTCIDIVVKSANNFASPSSSGSYASLTAALLDTTMRSEHMSAVAADICSKTKVCMNHIYI